MYLYSVWCGAVLVVVVERGGIGIGIGESRRRKNWRERRLNFNPHTVRTRNKSMSSSSLQNNLFSNASEFFSWIMKYRVYVIQSFFCLSMQNFSHKNHMVPFMHACNEIGARDRLTHRHLFKTLFKVVNVDVKGSLDMSIIPFVFPSHVQYHQVVASVQSLFEFLHG